LHSHSSATLDFFALRYVLRVSIIEIPANRGRVVLLIVASLLFVLAGAWMLVSPIQDAPLTLTKTIGFLSIAFFGLCGVLGFVLLLKREALLTLTPEKLINKSSFGQIPEIAWSEVERAEIVIFMNKPFLGVFPRDSDVLLARQPAHVRCLQSWNRGLVGTPIVITPSVLGVALEELTRMVQARIAEAHSLPSD